MTPIGQAAVLHRNFAREWLICRRRGVEIGQIREATRGGVRVGAGT
jgi:hypothetical protein